ncbi:MAG: fibro-slime domain-containing protein [Fibrobacterales bacterium]
MKHTITTLLIVITATLLSNCISDNDDYLAMNKDSDLIIAEKRALESSVMACTDQIDNDNDGDTDCNDHDCAVMEFCNPEDNCTDGLDNDLDGMIDCQDPDCHKECEATEVFESTLDYCTDGIDNDTDGFIDCDDEDCEAFVQCFVPPGTENTVQLCSDGIDNDSDEKIDCEDDDCAGISHCLPLVENTAQLCQDGFDNDSDDLIDCEDPNCSTIEFCLPEGENTYHKCTDSIDNDDDGDIDCDDDDCSGISACLPDGENTYTTCTDGLDNDIDGAIDCDDMDCSGISVCLPEAENTAVLCGDGIDNDHDGDIDCADTECSGIAACLPQEENTQALCEDGYDNDSDGLIDCQDPDCAGIVSCNDATLSCFSDDYTPPSTIAMEMDMYDYDGNRPGDSPDNCSGIHENFGCHSSSYSVLKGMVKNKLGTNGLPQYKNNLWHNTFINSWWSTENGGVHSITYLNFTHRGNMVYEYDNTAFFPLGSANYGFAGHMHREFLYIEEGAENQNFAFTGDDDVFVFLNGNLVIDLGGIHTPSSDSFNLKEEADRLGISNGEMITFDFFIAERMPIGSVAKITVNIPCMMVN